MPGRSSPRRRPPSTRLSPASKGRTGRGRLAAGRTRHRLRGWLPPRLITIAPSRREACANGSCNRESRRSGPGQRPAKPAAVGGACRLPLHRHPDAAVPDPANRGHPVRPVHQHLEVERPDRARSASWGSANYQSALADPIFQTAIKNTLYYTVIWVPLTMVIGLVPGGHRQPEDPRPDLLPGGVLLPGDRQRRRDHHALDLPRRAGRASSTRSARRWA